MTFDPMTGKPIEENDTSSVQYDPMTGEPISQPEAPQQEAGGFDPMTGEPIGQPEAPQQEAGGFDPMTGMPIGQGAPQQEAGGFDPMTGMPIGQGAASNQGAAGFDPMTGMPIGQGAGYNPMPEQNPKGKNNKLPLLIGVVAAVVALAVVVFVIINSGLLLGKADKVILATSNTLKDAPHFVEALEPLNVLNGNKYTVSASGEMDGDKMSGELRVNDKEKQVSITLDFDGYPKLEVLAGIDSKSVKAQIPAISKNVFVYNYTQNNKGYLVDEIDDIDELNSLLESLSKSSNKNISEEIKKVIVKEFKSLKFANAEKEEYTINEKDVTCKGYVATVTSDNLINIVDGIEAVMNDYYASMYDNDMLDTDDIAEEFEDLSEEFEDFDDIEISFYIYKNKLAAIKIDGEDMDQKVEFCFEGGDYRMQNMALKSGSYKLLIKGEDNGSKEEFTLKERYGSDSEQIGSLEYNYESGKFSVNLSGTSFSGKLTKSGSGMTIKIDRIGSYYYIENLELTISEGAKMKKYQGKEFDLGNADEDEFTDLSEDIMDELYDSDLYYLLNDLF